MGAACLGVGGRESVFLRSHGAFFDGLKLRGGFVFGAVLGIPLLRLLRVLSFPFSFSLFQAAGSAARSQICLLGNGVPGFWVLSVTAFL